MNLDMRELRQQVRAATPLIHCITNPISIHQCANTILAVGARPMMAEHPAEVAEITVTAGALMLNLGNITDVRLASMRIAARTAAEHHIPVMLDLCGVACSTLRINYVRELLAEVPVAVLKGNYSEVYALAEDTYRASGVDADAGITAEMIASGIAAQAKRYHCTVFASGKYDIVSDGTRTVMLENGTPQLATVTGTGCMLGALCAAYLSVGSGFDASVTACAVLGIAGEEAETERGSGTFMVRLMDQLCTLSDETIAKNLRIREV